MSAATIASARGGKNAGGGNWLMRCPVPAHGKGRGDRSPSLTIADATDGRLLVSCKAGCDPIEVLRCLDPFARSPALRHAPAASQRHTRTAPAQAADDADEVKIERAIKIWQKALDPRGTLVEAYLREHRHGLELPDEVAVEVIRLHRRCPWKNSENGQVEFRPAMVAAMRSITTNEITAIHRTLLNADGSPALNGEGKKMRRMLGVTAGAAIKLDADEDVTQGLILGEGVETVLAARQLGLRPAWAMGSAGAIATFPVLPGIEGLTLLEERENDGTPDKANERAVQCCGERWHEAEREVIVIDPQAGDINDALKRSRAA